MDSIQAPRPARWANITAADYRLWAGNVMHSLYGIQTWGKFMNLTVDFTNKNDLATEFSRILNGIGMIQAPRAITQAEADKYHETATETNITAGTLTAPANVVSAPGGASGSAPAAATGGTIPAPVGVNIPDIAVQNLGPAAAGPGGGSGGVVYPAAPVATAGGGSTIGELTGGQVIVQDLFPAGSMAALREQFKPVFAGIMPVALTGDWEKRQFICYDYLRRVWWAVDEIYVLKFAGGAYRFACYDRLDGKWYPSNKLVLPGIRD